MIRNKEMNYSANPEDIGGFHDMITDPDERVNVIDVCVYRDEASTMRRGRYRHLVARGDRFARWLAFAGDIPARERIRPATAVERFITH